MIFCEAFKLYDTCGLPLINQIDRCAESGVKLSIPCFIDDALKAGWSQDKTIRVVHEAVTDYRGAKVADDFVRIINQVTINKLRELAHTTRAEVA